jgi:hypothetical protein
MLPKREVRRVTFAHADLSGTSCVLACCNSRSTLLFAANDACALKGISARYPPLPELQALFVTAKTSTAK